MTAILAAETFDRFQSYFDLVGKPMPEGWERAPPRPAGGSFPTPKNSPNKLTRGPDEKQGRMVHFVGVRMTMESRRKLLDYLARYSQLPEGWRAEHEVRKEHEG